MVVVLRILLIFERIEFFIMIIVEISVLSQSGYLAEWKSTFLRNKGLENVLSAQVAVPNGPDTLIILYIRPPYLE